MYDLCIFHIDRYACLGGNSGRCRGKIQAKCETKLFLPAAASVTFSLVLLIVTLPPCCARSTGYQTLKYLRLFWFSLLQECTACVTHRPQEQRSLSSISQDRHKIALFEAHTHTCFSFTGVGLQVVSVQENNRKKKTKQRDHSQASGSMRLQSGAVS